MTGPKLTAEQAMSELKWLVDDGCGPAEQKEAAQYMDVVLRELKHWKANHDHIKLRLAAILTRPDLPRMYVKAWQELFRMLDNAGAELHTAQNRLERLQFLIDEVRRKVTPESEIGQLLKD